MNTNSRSKSIIRTSRICIAVNFVLAAFKLVLGFLSNSVAIITDGINNVTDVLSSIITIIGTRLSEKEPDRKHPFGYGRIEYLSSLVIGAFILFAGIESFKNSIDKIINPVKGDYSTLTLLILAVAVVVKIGIGLYTKKQGNELDSEALIASGKDAVNDSIASTAVFIAGIIYILSGQSIEAYVGAIISLVIIKTGFDTLKESSDIILGESTDTALASKIRDSILSFPEIEGVYDIVIHSYGKEKMLGSAHIEISDRYKVSWVDNLQRAIIRKVKENTGVDMLGISVYAINTHSKEVMDARECVKKAVEEIKDAREMHGFYIDSVDKTMNFDVIQEFGIRSKEELKEELIKKVQEIYPEYAVMIDVDYDFTE